ncbi:MAG: serine hydrolase domain-containing protein [Alphaproteobacteria bacterium]
MGPFVSVRRVAAGLSAFILVTAMAAPLGAQSPVVSTGDAVGKKAEIEKIVSDFTTAKRPVGMMVGVIAGKDRQTVSFGEISRFTEKTPDAQTVFEIGSVTQTFTALLLARMVERGVMALDDPLQKWVPAGVTVPRHDGKPITLADLATHTSGLPREPDFRHFRRRHTHHLTVDRMYALLGETDLTGTPGTKFLYSNFGYALLAQAVTRASGAADWMELVQREIGAPLGLRATRMVKGGVDQSRLAQGYGPELNSVRYGLLTRPAFNGALGLRSTLDDMMQWTSFHMGMVPSPLASLLPLVETPRVSIGAGPGDEIALAWQSHPLRAGSKHRILARNGATLGFYSFVAFVKETQTGVVVLSNTRIPNEEVGVRILRLLNPEAGVPVTDDGAPVAQPSQE